MEKLKEQELKVTDNTGYINSETDKIHKNSQKIIEGAVNKKVESLRKQLNKLPEIYRGMKNNLTVNNNNEIRKMNENIANTGNHTASGYAISKRLNNINDYNKQLREIDYKKEAAEDDIKSQIYEAKYQGEIDKATLKNKIYEKNLDYYLKEKGRQDDYNLDVADFNEKRRVNDSDILKNNKEMEQIDNDIRLSNNEDLRKEDENRRKNELHDIDMEFIPKKNDATLKKAELDAQLTLAKIETEKIKSQSSKKGTGRSGKTEKENVMSKMSAKNIADSIKNQIGSEHYDSYGKMEIRFSSLDAFKLLMAWKKKYNLQDYIVNDASIYLGIQDYI